MQNQGGFAGAPATPPVPPTMPNPETPQGKNAGSVVGIIVIVLVLALGGFYFWGKQLREETPLPEESDTSLLVPAPGNEGVDEMIVNEEGAADKNVVPAPSNEEEI